MVTASSGGKGGAAMPGRRNGTLAYLGLGSNRGPRRRQIEAACHLLARVPGVTLLRVSQFRETMPVGGPPQSAFINGVAEICTDLVPGRLLAACHEIERRLGRDRAREVRWGPRTLDIDLLLYGDEIVENSELEVPHPRLIGRLFVLEPLAELAGDRFHPRVGRTIRELMESLKERQNV